MFLFDNKQWISDVDKVISVMPELDEIAGNSVLITGATGLICSSIVYVIMRYNEVHNKKIHLYAAGRSREKMRACFGSLMDRSDFSFVLYDATETRVVFTEHFDFIIHGASNAFPKIIIKEPVETIYGNLLGIKNLLEYAKEKNSKKVLFISSSEVYGKKDNNEPYDEEQYGYIDILNPRNSYAVGKRAAEGLCTSYLYEYGVESVIVRPGHIYGPTASVKDNRVSSEWAYQAARDINITMKSDGSQIRSYCYTLDCASAIMKVLIRGKSGHAYNISNPDSIISIKEMAQIISRVAEVKLEMEQPTEEEKEGFNPMSNSSLDSSRLLDLGWKGCFDATTGFDHTVKILKEIIRTNEI